MAPVVTVFLDYQNAHLGGHENWCPYGQPKHLCLIDPLQLALLVVSRRAPGGVLKEVQVFRGRPGSRQEPKSASRSDRQANEWGSDPRVKMFRRPLRYPRDYGQPSCTDKAQEKGVDVQLAINMVAGAIHRDYEVGMLVSHDTDLLPAIELAAQSGAHIEVVSWGGKKRLRGPGIAYSHTLDEADFLAVRDTRDYT